MLELDDLPIYKVSLEDEHKFHPYLHSSQRFHRNNANIVNIIEEYKSNKTKIVKVDDIMEFEKRLFEFIDTKYPELPEGIRTEKQLTEDIEKLMVKAIEEFKKEFNK